MRRLTVPLGPPSPQVWYLAIRDRKPRAARERLEAVHAAIIRQYDLLSQAVIGEIPIDSIGAAQECANDPVKADLTSCYKSRPVGLIALTDWLYERQGPRVLAFCPLCGTTAPETIDHCMPSDAFPEYSVHAQNLVPVCARCNSTKGGYWLDEAGRRMYLHPYVDDPPVGVFLELEFVERPGFGVPGVVFSLRRPHGAEDAQWALLESHFDRLGLVARYNRKSNDELLDVLAACKSCQVAGGEPRVFLEDRAEELTSLYGQSHWRAVMMSRLAQHRQLDTWVNALPGP